MSRKDTAVSSQQDISYEYILSNGTKINLNPNNKQDARTIKELISLDIEKNREDKYTHRIFRNLDDNCRTEEGMTTNIENTADPKNMIDELFYDYDEDESLLDKIDQEVYWIRSRNMSFPDIGKKLSITKDAARMIMNRQPGKNKKHL